MIDHYNAFISYKHAPEDNKVAEAVHKGLERFHIPGKLRKKTGMKRINRIFRDKDELPITSDLSDSIANALSDTDYLIVICSTNTKDSMWVPREIEYFLKNHSKRDVFTVLVNGEPADVIPDILKYEDKVVTDENGKEVSVRIPIEPLSCDYRMPPGKAKKTELPRLVSGIIGCAYDELMNRRRQYRMKQLFAIVSIVLAVMAAFCAYMYYSRDRIHKNYLESLRNQSRYLANESENLLEKEQRITALQLALEALPKSEEDDRPVTAEAVRALTDATLAYETNNGNNINAAWNYQMPSVVSDFLLSDDGKKIAIRDGGDVVGIWDTEDHKRLLYLDKPDSPISGMGFAGNSSFILWNIDTVKCYNADTGEETWSYSDEDDTFISGSKLMVNDSSLYICTYNGDYLNIDPQSGKLLGRTSITKDEGFERFVVSESKLSPDGKTIAFRGSGGWNDYAFGCLDLNTGKTVMSPATQDMIKDIEWFDDDTLMVASTYVDMSGSMSIGSKQLLSTDHSTVRCINCADMSEKWNADFVCNGVMIESGFVKLGEDRISYFSGNVVSVYDASTGIMQYSNNVNDSVIDVSDRDKDGEPVYITQNGGYATPAPSVDDDAVYYTRYFSDELLQVAISNGVYARIKYGHEIIYYGVHVFDEDWTELCDDAVLTGSALEKILEEDTLAFLSSEDDKAYLDVFGLGEDSFHYRTKLEDDKAFCYKLLGVHGGKVYIGYENSDTYDVLSVDPKAEKTDTEDSFKMSAIFDHSLSMKEGKLAYYFKGEGINSFLAIYDIDTKDKKTYDIPEEVGFLHHEPEYYENEEVVFLRGDADYVIDLRSGTASKIDTPEDWDEPDRYSDNSVNGLVAFSDGKKIIITDRGGVIKTTVRCPGVEPLGMTFSDNQLIVLYKDGGLFWYSVADGSMIRNVDASVYYNYNGDVRFEQDNENGLLFIGMDRLTDVVDTMSGYETTAVTDCYGYHKERDIFITPSKENGTDIKVGYYRRYTVGDLINKAKDILKGVEVSEELRSRYGITDQAEEKGWF